MLRKITTMLLASLLALGFVPALAQDEADDDEVFDFSQYEGIVAAVSRTWTIDFMAIWEQSEEADDMDELLDGIAILGVGGFVAEFDSEANAEAAFEGVREDAETFDGSELGLDTADVTVEDIDLADGGFILGLFFDDEDETGLIEYAFALSGTFVFAGLTFSDGGDAADGVAVEIVETLLDQAGDFSGPPDEYSWDGTSTGGLFDYFDAVAETLPEELSDAMDDQIYPVVDIEDSE